MRPSSIIAYACALLAAVSASDSSAAAATVSKSRTKSCTRTRTITTTEYPGASTSALSTSTASSTSEATSGTVTLTVWETLQGCRVSDVSGSVSFEVTEAMQTLTRCANKTVTARVSATPSGLEQWEWQLQHKEWTVVGGQTLLVASSVVTSGTVNSAMTASTFCKSLQSLAKSMASATSLTLPTLTETAL